MSALAHMIESRGVPAVALGLIRLHMEKTRPPRGLWTPFPLGRPLGAVDDAGFQRRVLRAALGLLQRTDGPAILEDWPEEAPGQRPTPGWRPRIDASAVGPSGGPPPHGADAWRVALERELAAMRPHWLAARAMRGRSTVGLAPVSMDRWSATLAEATEARLPDAASVGMPPVHALTLCDDLRAYHQEAATGGAGDPAPVQIDDWFWGETLAARAMIAARAALVAAGDPAVAPVATALLVPAPRLLGAA